MSHFGQTTQYLHLGRIRQELFQSFVAAGVMSTPKLLIAFAICYPETFTVALIMFGYEDELYSQNLLPAVTTP